MAEISLPPDQTGDTPTMYAGIKNMTEHEEEEKKKGTGGGGDDDEEGLSIFGIPIPKIPLPILSFGLTPAISHGLLPIGRKGDAAVGDSREDVTPPAPTPADRRTRLPAAGNSSQNSTS